MLRERAVGESFWEAVLSAELRELPVELAKVDGVLDDDRSPPPPSSSSRRIDENWLQQWIAFGMLDMAIYLNKQAKFAAYLANRDQPAKRRARVKKS